MFFPKDFTKISKNMTCQALFNFKYKGRLPFLEIKVSSFIDLDILVIQ